ncbi:MAG: TonB-dependent receptor [Acidobacteriota bacterium]
MVRLSVQGIRRRLFATAPGVVIFLLVLALGGSAAAQVNTGTIGVVVVDNSNQPLPGVTVRVTSPTTGLDSNSVTGVAGTARLAALPPGTYDVTFELQGFNTLSEKGLLLRVGQTQVINATMTAKLTETVTVTAEAPIVDVHKTDSSTNILPEQIDTLPVADRDFQRLSFIAPTVQRERGAFRFVTGGPVIGAGGNASSATILVDGVDFTDPALGLATTRFSQDAIREFRVIANRFDSEIGGSAGGALSIVTRSGSNQYSGKFFGFFRDKALRAQGALELTKPAFSRQQFGGAVGGPIKTDKTQFFASIEQINEDNVTLFRPKGAYASQAADLALPTRQTLAFFRLDHQMSNSQRLAAKLVFERFRQDNFRVGGVADQTQGLFLNRDNFNFNAEDTWVGGANKLNQFYVQVGRRKYDEPGHVHNTLAEWFSSGNTLQTGGSIYDGLLGEGTYVEFRDTFTLHKETKSGTHDLKLGAAWQAVKDRFLFNSYPAGLIIYVTDTRALPLAYVGGTGSADSNITTNRIAGYVQDDWAVKSNFKVNLGLRYDVDTNGNNPGFAQPTAGITTPRKRDLNNIQPRGSFTWDVDGTGRNVVRGGAGIFTGRFLLVPSHTEIQQNGVTGRITQQRVNGAVLGLPAAYWLDPANPTTTGVPAKIDIALLSQDYVAPQATQATFGWTSRMGKTGLYFDTEFIYVKGTNEVALTDKNWRGNANVALGRPNTSYNQMNVYTNEGHSDYKAWVASLNGTLKGGHLITASYTLGSKKNISDDFSPEFPSGYPNDPANLGAEYGRSRSDERHRIVVTGVFRVPYGFTVAPIVEYGSGQPWTQRLGYDFNGDGKNSDRPSGVSRFGQNGPVYKQVSLRLTKALTFGNKQSAEFIAEVFNLFDTTNWNVAAIDGAMYLSGPTLANPAAAYVTNSNYGKYSATLPSREFQLGVRYSF